MLQARDYLLSAVPAGETVLTDHGTAMMLAYYLRSGDSAITDMKPYEQREIGGLRVVVAPAFDFLNQDELKAAIAETRRLYQPQRPMWVAAGGFVIRVDTPADQLRSFTDAMTVFQVPPAQ